jgi:hypothetical protein
MINDEDLLLYHYRELEPADRARVAAAIAADATIAQRLHALVARLDAAASIPDVPVPPHVQQRWRVALDRAAQGGASEVARPRFSLPRWHLAAAAAGAVMAVALVLAFQALRSPVTTPDNRVVTTEPAGDDAGTGSAYERGLKWHLASTERQIASLGDASPEERTRLLEAIVGQNRLYALAAERAGEPQLARVLRAFNPILEDLAKGRSESTAADLSQLSFELRVMQARLGAAADGSSRTL